MKYFVWLLLLLASLMFGSVAAAQVRLNEIYPGGSPEWVELYNTASSETNLINWYLDDIADGGASPKKISITIPALGYQILEFTSVFNNSGGDSVRLLNPEQEEIDRFDYTESVSLTDYFQRCPDGSDNWLLTSQSSQLLSNLVNCPTPTEIAPPTPTDLPTPTIQNTPGVLAVYLSEIMVYPDNETEWVEIYNDNDFAINLVDWYLDDKEDAGSTLKKFSLSLNSKSYGVIELSNHIFNNDQDSVRLLDQNQNELDSLEYSNPKKGESYSRQSFANDAIWCFTTTSKNTANNSCPPSGSILAAIDVLEISPTAIIIFKQNQPTQSLILPNSFKLNERFYQLKPIKVLGAKTTKPNKQLISQFPFWLRYTKITLWLNLALNLMALIYLSWCLRDYFRLWPGWALFLSFPIEKKSPLPTTTR